MAFVMTALMPDRTRPSAGELRRDLRHRRPLVLLAPLAGAAAAASTLVVCLALGVAGWFLTDAGTHGAPRDGLWVGALAWLMAHGSGVHVAGTLVSVMPLGITLAAAWATWRIGHRLGDSISGHGPDAQRLADGERDWTVPAAAALYAAGYVAVAFATDLDTALNVTSQLGTDTTGTVQLVAISLLVVPNAVAFSGSYLLGPGFTVGTHTLVSPSVVTVGALPMFPLLAALPDTGPTPGWTTALVGVAPLVGALGAMRAQRTHPTYRWEEGALHGCGGGMLAGALFAVLALLSGGAVGPGRMADVGPLVGSVLVHAVTAFGIGGLLGGLLATWWQRRRLEPLPEPEPADDPEATQASLTPVGHEDEDDES